MVWCLEFSRVLFRSVLAGEAQVEVAAAADVAGQAVAGVAGVGQGAEGGAAVEGVDTVLRSEERRVGKECRCGGWWGCGIEQEFEAVVIVMADWYVV